MDEDVAHHLQMEKWLLNENQEQQNVTNQHYERNLKMVQQKSEEGETGKRNGEDFRGEPEENDRKEKIQEKQLTEVLSKT